MNDLQPLKNQIMVQHLDFGSQLTRGGVILLDDDGSERGIHPRWAQVWRIGEDVKEIKEGDWILIEHGRWSRTTKMKVDGEEIKINRVDYPKGILVVSDHRSDDTYTKTTKSS